MYDLAAKWLLGKEGQTLEGALAFVPWIVQQAHKEGKLGDNVVVGGMVVVACVVVVVVCGSAAASEDHSSMNKD